MGTGCLDFGIIFDNGFLEHGQSVLTECKYPINKIFRAVRKGARLITNSGDLLKLNFKLTASDDLSEVWQDFLLEATVSDKKGAILIRSQVWYARTVDQDLCAPSVTSDKEKISSIF